MRTEENCVILEGGDNLFRYNLGRELPTEWSIDYSNPEYTSTEFGRKNKIGAFFFYDKDIAAKQVLAQAIFNQRKRGNEYQYATITHCQVVNDIKLLDLYTGLYQCSNMISALYEIGINVISDQFYNYSKELSYLELNEQFELLYSEDPIQKTNAANKINEFFFNHPPLFGQLLTDFDNGIYFKEMLINQGFEGYAFMEEFASDTYCLLCSDKISAPIHNEIFIEDDEDLQRLIGSITK